MFGIMLNGAVFWFVLKYVLTEHEVPSFRLLVLTMVIISFINSFISSYLGLLSIIPNFAITTLALVLFFRIDLKRALISVGVYQVVMLIIQLVMATLLLT
jgi:hypothetical protein